jgi:hypothetical protein
MRFRIYLRRFGKLIKLYKLHRNRAGLYIFSFRNKDYVSYHEDGKYWIRSQGTRFVKKLRQPLSSFKGAETLFTSLVTILAPMPDDLNEAEGLIKVEDIVLELEGNFCVEIILSESRVELPELPARLNRAVFFKENWGPLLTIEAFQMEGNAFPIERYPSRIEWVEGKNYFIDHTGRI